jgi:hypothetical protein
MASVYFVTRELELCQFDPLHQMKTLISVHNKRLPLYLKELNIVAP